MMYLKQEFEFADFMRKNGLNPSDDSKVFDYIGQGLEFSQRFAYIGNLKAVNDNKLTTSHDGLTSSFTMSNGVIDFIVNEQLLSDSIINDNGSGSKIKLYVKTLSGIVVDVVGVNTSTSENEIFNRWKAEYTAMVRMENTYINT